jgi:hypothetical protein
MITIVNLVPVIKVKIIGLSFADLFNAACACVTQMKLQRLTIVVIKHQLGGLHFVLCNM